MRGARTRPSARLHAELDEVRDGRALGQQVPLGAVVARRRGRAGRRLAEDPGLAPPGEHLPVGVRRLEERLAELAARSPRRAAASGRLSPGSRRSSSSRSGAARATERPARSSTGSTVTRRGPSAPGRGDGSAWRRSASRRPRGGRRAPSTLIRPPGSATTQRSWPLDTPAPGRHGERRSRPRRAARRSRSPSSSPRRRSRSSPSSTASPSATTTLRTVPCIGLTTAPSRPRRLRAA